MKTLQPHGTHERYWQGCRCVPCRGAYSRYVCDRRRKREAGIQALIDAAEAREVIADLQRRTKASVSCIAATSGLTYQSVNDIINGRKSHVRRDTLEALKGSTGIPTSGRRFVPIERSRMLVRRMRSSHPMRLVCEACGLSDTTVRKIANGRGKVLQARTATAIERAAVELGVWTLAPSGPAEHTVDTAIARQLIDSLDLDFHAVLAEAGMTQDVWSQVQSGRMVTGDRLERLARAIGTTPERLVIA